MNGACDVSESRNEKRKLNGLFYKDRGSGSEHVTLDDFFMQIDLLPNTERLKGALEREERGEIIIDDRGQTSLPGVFTAGDATTVPHRQIVIAMGTGSTAALSTLDRIIRSPLPVTEEISEVADA